MKKLLRFIFDYVVLGVLVYILLDGIDNGEVQIRSVVYNYSETPIMYSIVFLFILAVALLWVAVIGNQAFYTIDKKVKEFGGDYNINTFKAIFKSFFRAR